MKRNLLLIVLFMGCTQVAKVPPGTSKPVDSDKESPSLPNEQSPIHNSGCTLEIRNQKRLVGEFELSEFMVMLGEELINPCGSKISQDQVFNFLDARYKITCSPRTCLIKEI